MYGFSPECRRKCVCKFPACGAKSVRKLDVFFLSKNYCSKKKNTPDDTCEKCLPQMLHWKGFSPAKKCSLVSFKIWYNNEFTVVTEMWACDNNALVV